MNEENDHNDTNITIEWQQWIEFMNEENDHNNTNITIQWQEWNQFRNEQDNYYSINNFDNDSSKIEVDLQRWINSMYEENAFHNTTNCANQSTNTENEWQQWIQLMYKENTHHNIGITNDNNSYWPQPVSYHNNDSNVNKTGWLLVVVLGLVFSGIMLLFYLLKGSKKSKKFRKRKCYHKTDNLLLVPKKASLCDVQINANKWQRENYEENQPLNKQQKNIITTSL